MVLIKKMSAPITVGWMRLTYRRDTPANMVWEEINSETLAMHANTCKGVHAHTLLCVINYTNKQSRFWPEKKLFTDKKGASSTERDKEGWRGKKSRRVKRQYVSERSAAHCSLLLAFNLRLFCSFAPLLYLALTAVCCCRLSHSQME